jgi:phosphoribosylformylglycinamidine synthase subunit PurS
MKYRAEIDVMPLEELLDPQGKAVTASMTNIGLPQITNVRIGKHISFSVEAANKADAEIMAKQACEKLLANQVMEYFRISITEE